MNYFQKCKTVEEIKSEYRRLAKLHHPDRPSGDHATMQAINAQYHEALEAKHNSVSWDNDEQPHTYHYHAQTEQAIVDKIGKILAIVGDDAEVFLVGIWIWIFGGDESAQGRAEIGRLSLATASESVDMETVRKPFPPFPRILGEYRPALRSAAHGRRAGAGGGEPEAGERSSPGPPTA